MEFYDFPFFCCIAHILYCTMVVPCWWPKKNWWVFGDCLPPRLPVRRIFMEVDEFKAQFSAMGIMKSAVVKQFRWRYDINLNSVCKFFLYFSPLRPAIFSWICQSCQSQLGGLGQREPVATPAGLVGTEESVAGRCVSPFRSREAGLSPAGDSWRFSRGFWGVIIMGCFWRAGWHFEIGGD